MNSKQPTKTLVQCDFDGTVTEVDVSFALLDAYASDWRERLKDYQKGRISVGRFNTEVFARVKADRATLIRIAKDNARLRAGFPEMVACCRRKGFRLVIVSNGLDFYIRGILKDLGLTGMEVFAARTHFRPQGLKVQYVGPDGQPRDDAFKEAYVDLFLSQGYRIIYVGNGDSDFLPARKCHHVFATGNLLKRCRQAKLDCISFSDFNEVVSVLERFE
jgi:2-hydroxy-3-keto-5-methylthiopentenyl-1-phosphate phosphatase